MLWLGEKIFFYLFQFAHSLYIPFSFNDEKNESLQWHETKRLIIPTQMNYSTVLCVCILVGFYVYIMLYVSAWCDIYSVYPVSTPIQFW